MKKFILNIPIIILFIIFCLKLADAATFSIAVGGSNAINLVSLAIFIFVIIFICTFRSLFYPILDCFFSIFSFQFPKFATWQDSDRWKTSRICPAGHYINNLGCRRHPRTSPLSKSSSGRTIL
jgi:hypothetical protein